MAARQGHRPSPYDANCFAYGGGSVLPSATEVGPTVNENLKTVKAEIQRYRWLLQTNLTKARCKTGCRDSWRAEERTEEAEAIVRTEVGPTLAAHPPVRPALLKTAILRTG